jgi:2-oxo-4-hydroxy-4-carboxy-5-ureidoimidazoline decarboxylase
VAGADEARCRLAASDDDLTTPDLAGAPLPAQSRGRDRAVSGLDRFNTTTPGRAEAALLACCGSRRWARRLVSHRPYPDLDALLAAAEEASYDLTSSDLVEALADESSPGLRQALPGRAGPAAHTALRAAHAAYESRFGHVFVICLDGLRPEELLDHLLGQIRRRLGNEVDVERSVTADELRCMALGRLARLVGERPRDNRPRRAT